MSIYGWWSFELMLTALFASRRAFMREPQRELSGIVVRGGVAVSSLDHLRIPVSEGDLAKDKVENPRLNSTGRYTAEDTELACSCKLNSTCRYAAEDREMAWLRESKFKGPLCGGR